MRIGIMYSSGKDSNLTYDYYWAQGWEIACLITLMPPQGSWMFQQPAQKLVEMQAKSIGQPLVLQKTQGEKEEELKDLKVALRKAKETYQIQGVAVGALASDYQHERVNRVCEELELKCFSPLWHVDQEKIMRTLIDGGFDVRMTSIAAMGLDDTWIGRRLTHDDVDRLVELNKKYGLNIAGEGGEFETVVLDAPFFSRPIQITQAKVIKDAENEAHWDITELSFP